MATMTREETQALIQEVLEVYPDKAKKDRVKHLAVNDPSVEQSKKCITSNRKSQPGVMTVRGCAYAPTATIDFGQVPASYVSYRREERSQARWLRGPLDEERKDDRGDPN